MNEFTKGLNFWKLAILKVSGKALMAGILSIAATLNGAEWGNFTGTQKFMAFAVAIGSVWAVIDAFLSETMADMKKKKKDETFPPFNKTDVTNP